MSKEPDPTWISGRKRSTTVYLTENQYQRLKAISIKRNTPAARLHREAIDMFLEAAEAKQ